MADLILHHYPASPYAEKVRAILGFKKLAWKSVIIPMVMPKPDVIALTGGYRRTPILQIGADIYCDSGLIARVLERAAPSPTLFPYGDDIVTHALGHFGEAVLFNTAAVLAFAGSGVRAHMPDASPQFLDTFRNDRAAMRKGGSVRRGPPAECRAAMLHFLPMLEAQFRDGRPFLTGASPCNADFCVYHPLWAVARTPGVRAIFNPFPRVDAYVDRIMAFGHGKPAEISSAKALEVARTATPAPVGRGLATELEDLGIALGHSVDVLPVDYGFDPVRGELLDCSADEIVVRRTDSRAGTVHVHFPRVGYEVRKAV